ncbi:hypothetical protein D3C81_1296700 [compost metagenome]
MLDVKGVGTCAGPMALHRIFCGPYCDAIFLVIPTTACLEAVYANPPLPPVKPDIDAIFTIVPAPFSRKIGRTLREARITPVTLMPITRSHVSSNTLAAACILSLIPALFTNISMVPKASRVSTTMLVMSTSFVTFTLTPIASIPDSLSSDTVFWRPSSLKSATTIFAPSCPKVKAISFPMPEPLPVMMATLFFRRDKPYRLPLC